VACQNACLYVFNIQIQVEASCRSVPATIAYDNSVEFSSACHRLVPALQQAASLEESLCMGAGVLRVVVPKNPEKVRQHQIDVK
jgi:hypothetical protein